MVLPAEFPLATEFSLIARAPQDAAVVPAEFPFANRALDFEDTIVGATASGTKFDDASSFQDSLRVNRIIVMAGARIDQVQVNLSGPNGDINNIHGGSGGEDRTTILLAAGERVTNVKVWFSNQVSLGGLAFTTSGGTTFNCGTQDGTPDGDFDAPTSLAGTPVVTGLIGFQGTVADNEVAALGAIWGAI